MVGSCAAAYVPRDFVSPGAICTVFCSGAGCTKALIEMNVPCFEFRHPLSRPKKGESDKRAAGRALTLCVSIRNL
jgi:hypothetical protein